MNRRGKSLIITVVLTLLITMFGSAAMAKPYSKDKEELKPAHKENTAIVEEVNNKKIDTMIKPTQKDKAEHNIFKGLQKKVVFADTTGYWAQDEVALMNKLGTINGYEDNTFRPNQPVSQGEALVMITRAAGIQSELDNVEIPASVSDSKHIADWVKPYVALALQKNIITDQDLAWFNSNVPAKRFEVAVWMVRAMNLQKEAEKQTSDTPKFSDAGEVPDWARGYVVVISNKKVMNGYPGGFFGPNKPIKRGEMACLLVRSLDYQPSVTGEFQWIKGQVKEIDSNSITLTLPANQTVQMNVYADALVYVNDTKASLSAIEVGDRSNVMVDNQNNAIVIRAWSGTEQDENEDNNTSNEISGKYLALRGDITVNNSVYRLTEDVKVEIDGKEADLTDLFNLSSNDKIGLEVTSDGVTEIFAADTLDENNYDVTGKLEKLNVEIRVESQDKADWYDIAEDLTVKIDGTEADLLDLKTNDPVKVEIKDNKIVEITVD